MQVFSDSRDIVVKRSATLQDLQPQLQSQEQANWIYKGEILDETTDKPFEVAQPRAEKKNRKEAPRVLVCKV